MLSSFKGQPKLIVWSLYNRDTFESSAILKKTYGSFWGLKSMSMRKPGKTRQNQAEPGRR